MEVDIRASVHIVGSKLRYAEVEHYGGQRRLLRLGSCEFDYDAARQLFGSGINPDLEPIAEAVDDVFSRLASEELQVVLHPGNVLCFNSVSGTAASQDELTSQVKGEAQYLMNAPQHGVDVSARPLATTSESSDEQWYSVVAFPSQVKQRLKKAFSRLNGVAWSLQPGPQCAAEVFQQLREQKNSGNDELRGFDLVVGWHEDCVNFSVLRGGDVALSQSMSFMDPADTAYFGLQLFEALDLDQEDCTGVWLYGDVEQVADFELLAVLSGELPKLLNPIELVEIEDSSLLSDFNASGYVPAMGAVLQSS